MPKRNKAQELEQRIRKLTVNEKRLQQSLECSGSSFWEWFPQTGHVEVDEHWAADLGYEPGEKIFDIQWWLESVHPDSRAEFETAMIDYLEGRKPFYELEYRIKTQKGEWKWISASGGCIEKNLDGKPIRFLGTHKDITEYKLTEEKLREAVLKKDEAIKAGNIGLWDRDLATNKVSFSAEWKLQIGYDEHEIGDDFNEWKSRIHPDDLVSTLGEVQRCIDGKSQHYKVEFRFRHKDGTYRWILSQGSVISDENRHPVRILGSHIDITEYKMLELQLRESEKRFRELAELLPETIFEADNDLNLTYVNLQGFSVFGYTARDLENGLNGADMLVPEDRQRAKENLDRHLRRKKSGPSEYRALKKDGTAFPILLHAAPVIEQEIVKGLRGIIVDITKTKELEKELIDYRDNLEEIVKERTKKLQTMINSMAGREIRMKELKKVIIQLRDQLEKAGMTPVTDDPLKS